MKLLATISLLAITQLCWAQAPCPVKSGCTGVGTITGIIAGNGTSPFTAVTIGTGLTFSGGTLSSAGTPGGSNTHVQFNDSGVLGGTADSTFIKATGFFWLQKYLSVGSESTYDANRMVQFSDIRTTTSNPFGITSYFTGDPTTDNKFITGLDLETFSKDTNTHPIYFVNALNANAFHQGSGAVNFIYGAAIEAANLGAGHATDNIALYIYPGGKQGSGAVDRNIAIQVDTQGAGSGTDVWALKTEGATDKVEFAGPVYANNLIRSNSAIAGSNGSGIDLILRPGAKDGSGTNGTLLLKDALGVTKLQISIDPSNSPTPIIIGPDYSGVPGYLDVTDFHSVDGAIAVNAQIYSPDSAGASVSGVSGVVASQGTHNPGAHYGVVGQCFHISTGTMAAECAAGWFDLGNYSSGVMALARGISIPVTANAGGGSITTIQAIWVAEQSVATNNYSFWDDTKGVLRIKRDLLDGSSNAQAIIAGYNPRVTKYVPGATDYERWVIQWLNNVVQIGTEAGGIGTLRNLQFLGPVTLATIYDASTGFRIGGAAAAAHFLRGNGTNYVDSAIQVSDVPTLNQDTTGSAAKLTTARTIAGVSFDGTANIAIACSNLSNGVASCSTDTTVASNISSGTLPAGRMPALTGDVTSSAGAVSTTLANVPSGTPHAGSILFTAIAAPGTPASGKGSVYVDSTSKNLAIKNDAGTINHGVQTKTSTSNQWLTAIADDGTVSASQPGFSNLSGSVAASQMPALTGDITTSAGAVATTLATVNSNVGSYTNANITVNAKGLITAAANGSSSVPGYVTAVSVASLMTNFGGL